MMKNQSILMIYHLVQYRTPAGSVDVKFDGSLANVPHHEHVLVFYGNHFTVNGGPERDMNHPSNAKLLESVKNYQIPEELAADGLHTIRVIKTFKSLNNVKVVRDERLDEHHRLMSSGMGM
ncbi:hypothetical protein C5167_004768 [Papaver somniferum]|uniref:SEP domain-containing protein n=1 Tax=Papaver somniferum TaxID=3469 RepID=A0A4Y7JBT4_PAPSO|nr:uncharacterized protein LOC113273594 [Papaver somniferum]RZC57470.1 hypothetical protein C5167_004768 [Papaver somniferum]